MSNVNEEVTGQVTLFNTSFRVKLSQFDTIIHRLFKRIDLALIDHHIRAELTRDGYEIVDLEGGDWFVNLRRLHLPAELRLSNRALDRLIADINRGETDIANPMRVAS